MNMPTIPQDFAKKDTSEKPDFSQKFCEGLSLAMVLLMLIFGLFWMAAV
jgi:hypothetical protein